jgi:hypothetical protein
VRSAIGPVFPVTAHQEKSAEAFQNEVTREVARYQRQGRASAIPSWAETFNYAYNRILKPASPPIRRTQTSVPSDLFQMFPLTL